MPKSEKAKARKRIIGTSWHNALLIFLIISANFDFHFLSPSFIFRTQIPPNKMDDVHPAYRGQGELQFLKIIAEEIENAEYRPGTTFTKESERYVFRRFRTKLGPIYSDRFLRSRFKTIKKRYLEFTEMISKPGLYWDKKNNIVSGNEELLRAEYMHRRRNGLYYGEQHYDLMCQIFGSEVKFE